MANTWDKSPDPERRRPEPSAVSNSGIDGSDLWGDTDLPPAENELYVLDLLQKLEAETNNGAAPMFEKRTQQPTKWAQWDPEVTCAACHYLNAADQRFCGHCGSPLRVKDLPRPDTASLPEPPARPSQPARSPELPALASVQKPAERAPSAFSPVRSEPREESREMDESNLEFLRYKTLGASPPSRDWKIPVAVAVLAISGFVGYRLYNGLSILPGQSNPPATRPLSAANVRPPSEESSQASGSEVANAAAAPTPIKPEILAAKPKTVVPLRAETRGAVTSATQRSREGLTAATTPNAGDAGPMGGGAELAQAQRYLSPASRDSAVAAKWLWKSVSKENPKAVLLLSDLYAKGDGVPKSCDQARLLLTVAAKKGQPEAVTRLRSFDSKGCQ